MIRIWGQVGRLSCSASGHAWLSCLPEDEALALVEKQGDGSRREYGPHAPVSRSALVKYLRQSRKRAIALVLQTYAPWINSIAAPVRELSTREVIGAVVIAGPHVWLTEERILELAPALLEAAGELALTIGSSPGLGRRHDGTPSNFFMTRAK